jgi:allantoinase
MAELLSTNPARRFGLRSKGQLSAGYDGDVVLFDPSESFTVDSSDSESTQGYSVFEGHKFQGKVTATFLRGQLIFDKGKVLGEPKGIYLHRPY